MSQGNLRDANQLGKNTPWQRAMSFLSRALFAKVTAAGGSLNISSTSGAITGEKFVSFSVQEDTVISTMTGGTPPQSNKDYLTYLGISGETLHQGAFFTVPDGEYIQAVTVASGSIIAYRD